ncbi:MAG: hypothetical protein U1F76_23445 [Candidatus Competibacteraceae bacterium]
MNRPFLSGITEAMKAFSGTPAVSSTVEAAARILRSVDSDQGLQGLGFRKKRRKIHDTPEKKAILSEHGIQLNDNEMMQLIKYLKDKEEVNIIRRRFWMQCMISLVLILFSLGILLWGKPAMATEKSLFGLLGTIIGYWLR